MHIISENVLILFTKTYQNCSMLAETTACQSLRVFFETQCTINVFAARLQPSEAA